MNLENEEPLHPTAQKLVDTVIAMLETTPYTAIKSENVLRRSGITRGPLYHHFQDFGDLIAAAHSQIYRANVDELTDHLLTQIKFAKSPPEAKEIFMELLSESLRGESTAHRRVRLGVLHGANTSPQLHAKIALIQDELNERWVDIYKICVEKGWTVEDVDSRAIAIMMQATFMGSVLDDLSPSQLGLDIWVQTLARLFEYFFLTRDSAAA